MTFGRDFFDLQFSFAEVARDVSGVPIESALLEYTNFYARFGFGRDFNSAHDGWRAYVTGLRGAADRREWTYRFYRMAPERETALPVVATFGCFSYELRPGGVARLHFQDAESGDRSTLSIERVEQRRAELRALAADVKSRVGADAQILGASWLYNLHAYRRLFPPSFVSSARPFAGGYRSMPLWGQFVDRRGELRARMAQSFSDALANTTKLSELGSCFPLRVLTARAPVGEFSAL